MGKKKINLKWCLPLNSSCPTSCHFVSSCLRVYYSLILVAQCCLSWLICYPSIFAPFLHPLRVSTDLIFNVLSIFFFIILSCLWPSHLNLLKCVKYDLMLCHYAMPHHVSLEFVRKQANNLPSGQYDLKADKLVYSSLRPPNLSKLQRGSTTAEKKMAQLQTAA